MFFDALDGLSITVPVVLNLDHTRKVDIIWDAIEAGFPSVMIDASEKPLVDKVIRL